ncbi:DUF4132 domain-containing protein [Nocardia sp. NPDC058058]|uniref:DUF4132 domain-containing protein n=1 Tax=Nocardia sp. NPDC058058 TaxID=3346317 RepID=UPI0036DEED4E
MAEAPGRDGGEAVAAEDRFAPPEALRKLVRIRRGGLSTPEHRDIDMPGVTAKARALTVESYEAALLRLESRDPAFAANRTAHHIGNLLTAAATGHDATGFDTATWELTTELAGALIATRAERSVRPTPKERRIAGEEVTALLDYWFEVRGIEFAAEALMRAVTAPLWRKPNSWSDGALETLRGTLAPLRTRLADHAELEGVIAVLERFRTLNRHARVIAAYVLPSQHEWVATAIDEVAAADRAQAHARLLVDAAHTPDQLRQLDKVFSSHWYPWPGAAVDSASAAMTVVDGVGFEVLPVLLEWLEHPEVPASTLKGPVAQAIATIPTDAAFSALAERADRPAALHAIRQAAEWFPRRALRLLDAHRNADILRELVHRSPALAAELLPQLPTQTAELVSTELASVAAATANDQHVDIPAILTTPPWQRTRPAPVVIAGLTAPDTVRCAWLPGEHAQWLAAEEITSPDNLRKELRQLRPSALSPWDLYILLNAEPDYVRPLLATARMSYTWHDDDTLRVLIARYETDAYPLVLDIARRSARDIGEVLLPFESAAAVELAVQWLERRTLRPLALGYLGRHAEFASRALIPDALSKGMKARRVAGRTLRLLAELGHGEAIRTAAATYGAKVTAGVEAVLATDPVEVLPARLPVLPDWVNIAVLPPISAGACTALPLDAMRNLLTMLLLSTPGAPYAGIEVVKNSCDAGSLAEFAWAVYRQWWQAGAPTKHYWVYEALGGLGDDTTVEQLLADVRRQSDPRALPALDTFVAIGSDAALLALRAIGEKGKSARVREAAQSRITEIADRLGLTPDQLADRLVPDLGLRADGTVELDFGPRRFVIGFDEQLRPTLTTGDGKTIKTLPKAGVNDDAERAEQAHKTFRKIKKDARALAADQIARLERAMVTQRRFTVAELRELFIAHPLRWHITRRVVWGVYQDGMPISTFRIAEDRSFADHVDEAVTIAEDAILGVAHPLHFADDNRAWAEVFADYELLQPFPQLSRETYTLPEALRGVSAIPGDGTKVDGTRFLGLTARGWSQPQVGDGGHLYDFEKPLPGERFLQVLTSPGIASWDPRGDQTFDVRLYRRGRGGVEPTFGELDPVTASEMLRDLAWLRHAAG